jgi:RNA polymerase sigma-70 factor, ECF subfamily
MATLLQQIALGDQRAVESAVQGCVRAYGGLIYALAYRYLAEHRGEVEDAVQDVFVNLWQAASAYDPAFGSETAFVATIARRRIIDFRRRLLVRQVDSDMVNSRSQRNYDGSVNAVEGDEQSKIVQQLAGLPEDERKAVWLAIGKGMSHREIAIITSVPVGTVKSRLRRGVMRLQEASRSTSSQSQALSTEEKL